MHFREPDMMPGRFGKNIHIFLTFLMCSASNNCVTPTSYRPQAVINLLLMTPFVLEYGALSYCQWDSPGTVMAERYIYQLVLLE